MITHTAPPRALQTYGPLTALILLGLIPRALSIASPYGFPHDWDWSAFGCQVYDMLCGQFRAFRYGQHYLGSFPLLADMLNFKLFGPTRFALFLGSLYYWVLFQCVLYALVRRIFSHPAALLAVLATSFSPRVSYFLCAEPSRGYLDVMILGLLIYLAAIGIATSPGRRTGLWTWLGLLSGLAFWTSFQSAYYLIPVTVLLLIRDPLFLIRPQILAALAAFAAGSLPLWFHNLLLPEKMTTFQMVTGNFVRADYWVNACYFFTGHRVILGLRWGNPLLIAASVTVALTLLAALAWMAHNLLRVRTRAALLASPRACGQLLLGLQLVTFFIMYTTSGKYGGPRHTLQYVMLLYAVYAAVLGGFWNTLRRLAPPVAYATLTVYAVFYTWSQFADNNRISAFSHWQEYYATHRQAVSNLCDFLTRQGARDVAVAHGDVYGIILSFDAVPWGIRFVEPLDRYTPRRSLEMDARPAYFRMMRGGPFLQHVKAMGFEYQRAVFGHFTVCHDFQRPSAAFSVLQPGSDYRALETVGGGQPLPAIDDRALPTFNAFGGEGGLVLDIRNNRSVDRLLLQMPRAKGTPNRLAVAASQDGKTWTVLRDTPVCMGLFSAGNRPVERPFGGLIEIDLPAASAPARYLRLYNPEHEPWWLAELFVLSRTGPASPPDPAAVAQSIAAKKPQAVYADPPLAAWLMVNRPGLPCFNEYDLEDAPRSPPSRIDSAVRNVLVVDEAFSQDLVRLLVRLGAHASHTSVAGREVFALEPSPVPVNLVWTGVTALEYHDPAVSFALTARGQAALDKNDTEASADMLSLALHFWPGNYRAWELLHQLDAQRISDLDMSAWNPRTSWSGEFGRHLTVLGYSAVPAQTKGRLFVRLIARTSGDTPWNISLLLLTLDAGEKALSVKNIHPACETDFHGVFPKGQRLLFDQEIDSPPPGCSLWLGLEDARGRRVPLVRLNGAPYTRSRALLADGPTITKILSTPR